MSDLIDRQVAIDALDKSFPVDPMRNDYTQGIACGVALAMEYIKQLPSAQPEPTVTGKFPVITLDTVFKNEASNINMASYDRDVVGITIPTAPLEVQPYVAKDINVPIKHGRWIEDGHYERCSECGEPTNEYHNYCPNCGARME